MTIALTITEETPVEITTAARYLEQDPRIVQTYKPGKGWTILPRPRKATVGVLYQLLGDGVTSAAVGPGADFAVSDLLACLVTEVRLLGTERRAIERFVRGKLAREGYAPGFGLDAAADLLASCIDEQCGRFCELPFAKISDYAWQWAAFICAAEAKETR